MPVLQTSEVFSSEALPYIEEYWAKAWLLRMVREKRSDLVMSILDGIHIPSNNISYDTVRKVINENNIENPFLRSTHPDDGVWYIWRLDNIQLPEHASEGNFTDIWLNEYSQRLWYRLSSETGLYIQESLHYDDVTFWNLVEDPHTPWVFYISWRKKLSMWTMAGVSKYGSKVKKDIFSEDIQTEIVRMYQVAREVWFMNEKIAWQMEFAVGKNWSVKILQFRAFRKKEEASWNLENKSTWSSEWMVFGITWEDWTEVNMWSSEWRFLDDFNDTSITWFHKRGHDRLNNVNPDIPLEQMKLITADPALSPFEHWLFEIASLSETTVFSQFWNFDFPHIDVLEDWELNINCRVFSDGQNFRIDIEN